MTTLETVTREQVEQLKAEAAEAGDGGMVEICERALPAFGSLRDVAHRDYIRGVEALAVCVRGIQSAEAMA